MGNTIQKQLRISILATDAATQTLKKIKVEFDKTIGNAGAKAKTEMSKVNQAFKTLKLKPFTEAKAKIKELEGAYKTLATSGKVSSKQLAQANLKLKVRTAQLGKETTGLTGAFMAMRTSLLTLAASFYVIIRVVAQAVTQFKKFDDAMRTVGAVSQAVGQQYQDLTNLALEMGRTTRYTSVEAAEGLKYLSMAGFKATKSMEALPGVLQLAAAGNLDLGQSADIATNILTGFGMEADKLIDVNNAMVYAFTNSNATLIDIAESLKIVAPIIQGVGGSFSEATAAVSLLSKAGLKGTLSATGLRGAIGRLMSPTKKESELMDELANRMGVASLSIKNAEGDFVGFISIIEQLEKAGLKGDEALELFGLRAGPTISALLGQGSEALRDFTEAIEEEIEKGTIASDIMKRMEEGIGGITRRYKAAKEAMSIQLGKALWLALEPIVLLLTGFLNLISKIPTGILAVGLAFTAAIGGVSLWIVAIPILSIAVGFLNVLFATLIGMATTIGIVFGVILAVGLVLATAAAWWKYAESQKAVREEILKLQKVQAKNSKWEKRDVKTRMQIAKLNKKERKEYEKAIRQQILFRNREMALALKQHGAESAQYKEAQQALWAYTEQIGDLQNTLQDLASMNVWEEQIHGIEGMMDQPANLIVERYEDSKNEIIRIFNQQESHIREVGARIQATQIQIDHAIRESAIDLFNRKKALIDEYAENFETLTEEQKTGFLDAQDEMMNAVGILEDAKIQALNKYTDALKEAKKIEDQIRDAKQDHLDDIREIEQSEMSVKEIWKDDIKHLKDLEKAMKKAYKKGDMEEVLKLEKEMREISKGLAGEKSEEIKGRKEIYKTEKKANKEALKWLEKSNEYKMKALAGQKEMQEENAKSFLEQVDEITKLMKELVGTKWETAVHAYLDSSSFDKAMQAILDTEYKIDIKVNQVPGEQVPKYTDPDWQSLKGPWNSDGYAEGGPVNPIFKKRKGHIPGWGNKDDTPAMLTKGEFILTKDAVKNVGTSFLKRLNDKNFPVDLLPHFAIGGLVDIKKNLTDTGGKFFNDLTSIVPHFLGGGSIATSPTSASKPQYDDRIDKEKARINQHYNGLIKQAKARGDEDVVFILEEEKIKLYELAEELKKVIAEIYEEYDALIDEQKINLEELKETKKKLAPFGNSITLAGGLGVTFIRPATVKSLEQVNTEIPVAKQNIADLTSAKETEVKQAKKDNRMQIKELKLDTKQSVTGLTRALEDRMRELEEERREALGTLMSSYSSSGSSNMTRQYFETGGEVHGTKGIDKIPAMLTDGETIINATATKKLGSNFFKSINKLRLPNIKLPHFAQGGQVGDASMITPSGAAERIPKLGSITIGNGNDKMEVFTRISEAEKLVRMLQGAGQKLSSEG